MKTATICFRDSDGSFDCDEVRSWTKIEVKEIELESYDAIIFCVKHKELLDIGIENIKNMGKKVSVIFDVTSSLPKINVDGRLLLLCIINQQFFGVWYDKSTC